MSHLNWELERDIDYPIEDHGETLDTFPFYELVGAVLWIIFFSVLPFVPIGAASIIDWLGKAK